MKNIKLVLAHNYEQPIAAAVAAAVQLEARGLTEAIRDCIKSDNLNDIAASWGELVDFHGTDSKEIAKLRQVLNRVSKEVKGYPLTVEIHHQQYTVVKAKVRAGKVSPQTLAKRISQIAKMAENLTDDQKLEIVKLQSEALGLDLRIAKKPAKAEKAA